MHSEATRRVSKYMQAAAVATADEDEAVLVVAVAEVVEVGAEVVLALAVQMAMHENERGKIKTKQVEETIIAREDMIRRWRELGQVLDRLLRLHDFA